jgi:glyoxylase-like metal-dependent hydrolase (beta-lactamase superfamily II)
VLVDSGAYQEVMCKHWHDETKNVQTLEEGLAKHGLTPEDIDWLVFTHLHFDHAANAKLMKNATIIVQKIEYDFMNNPHPVFAGLYNPEFIAGMKLKLVEGDAEVVPGITVHLVPGHTPGAQAVAVDTAAGKAVITGFCSIGDVFTEDGVLTPGIHASALDAYDSALKVKNMADIVIPQHDPILAEKTQIPD